MSELKEIVKRTYTDAVLKGSGCGCGPSCCSPTEEAYFGEDYKDVAGYEPDADHGLGCGLPTEYAQIKEGDTVLDLGSGAGNDVFVARHIVGDGGQVIGVDFTEAMIEKANENKERLGFTNVEFRLGDIEALPVQDGSVDVAVSNCVMNLVPDKELAYSEVYRVLKPGGHFSISDIVLSGDLPTGVRNAAEMYAGCVSGALDRDTYLEAVDKAGFEDAEVLKEREVTLPDELLLNYIDADELKAYRASESAIISITLFGKKN